MKPGDWVRGPMAMGRLVRRGKVLVIRMHGGELVGVEIGKAEFWNGRNWEKVE